ncbi:MAG: molybdopterin-dependent oxidoreductase [Bellilinea sp.]|jgi:formate dehydrogenase major subunit
MVTIIIDDQKLEVSEGTTVLNAARKAGIHIPTLCDHPHLRPYGGCRLCMVEIEGFRTPQAACTLPVGNNMVIKTNTEEIRKARKFVLTLIFSERNHFCPYCQVSGSDCELQNAAYGEGMTHWPLQPNWHPNTVDASHPFFILEHNRCILCRRCIRACSELVGVNTLGVEERGAKTYVIADLNVPLGESTCVSCGMCVQVCPTGALIDRRSAYRGQTPVVDHHSTVCAGCSIGCGLDVITRDGQLIQINGDWKSTINRGVTCKVGRFYPVNDDRERISTPMVRHQGVLKPASWEEAIQTAVQKLRAAGDNGTAALASTRLPAESLYLFQQIFAEGLKSDTVTSLDEGGKTALISSAAARDTKPFEGSLEAVNQAGAFLVIGADLVNEHEVLGFFIRRRFPEGVRLVVIDSGENALGDLAHFALAPVKNSENALLQGLSAAVAKLGQSQTPFTGDADQQVQQASEKTGLSSDLLLQAAFKLSGSPNPVIIYNPDTLDEAALQTLLQFATSIGATLLSIKGGANALAAAQLDLNRPFKLNGHKVAYVALGDDQPSQKAVKSLEKIPSLIVQASYRSELTAMADVVFPVVNWLEQDGHFLNFTGQLQTAHKVLEPREGIWTNEAVMAAIAQRLGLVCKDDWKEALAKRAAPVRIVA